MKFRFSIGSRIGTGFGILIFFVIVVFYTTYETLSSSIEKNQEITTINNPSVAALEELKLLTVRSKMLIFNWVYYQSDADHPDKSKLKRLIERDYPHLKSKIEKLAVYWSPEDQKMIDSVFVNINQLFDLHKEVMELLPDFMSYEDTEKKFLANYYIGDDGDIYIKSNEVLFQLEVLINSQKHKYTQVTTAMDESFSFLQRLFRNLGIALVVGAIFIAFYTTRTIVKPIQALKQILLNLSKGIYPKGKLKERNDEIGEMTNALNRVVDGLNRTKEFANAVGAGKFETDYEPLSDQDALGKALLKMRDDLAENERILEQKVEERTAEVVKQKEEIELQNHKISELYNQVTDSIKYAKRIQEAILPPNALVKKYLPESFILYKPKDIVSGDFYWLEEKNGIIYFAAVDCTGHGVPGALMSIVGYNNLNMALSKASTPSEILDELNKGIGNTLHKNQDGGIKPSDGMDVALCAFDPKTNTLQYAGAFNPLYIIKNGELQQIKADKFPIGSYFENPDQKYTNHTITLEKGDSVFIFSDGYADQFGGPKGKKLMYKTFREILLSIYQELTDKQREILDKKLQQWKGNLEQVDDILVIGLRV